MSFPTRNIVFRRDLNRQMATEEMDNNLDLLKRFLNVYTQGETYCREEVVLIDGGNDVYQIAVCIVPDGQFSSSTFIASEWLVFDSGSGSGGDVSYVRPTATPTTVGGIVAGSTFNGTVQDVLDELLYPFIEASLSFSLSSPREKGTSQNIILNASVTVNDDTITNRAIKEGSTTLFTSNNNSFTYTDNNVTSDKTYTFEVTTQASGVKTSVASVQFVAPTFFGVAAVGADEATIEAMTKGIYLQQNRTITYSPVNQRMYYAYPASFGTLTRIVDQNGFNVTDGWESSIVNFSLADTTNESYRVYYNNSDTTQTNFQITFEF